MKQEKSTVEKALKLLTYFDEEHPRWGLSELARKASLSKATAYRLLSSLKRMDFVYHDPLLKKYLLGFRLLELGHRVQDRLGLREAALPFMEALRDKIQETVHVTIEVDGEGIYLDKVESPSSVRLSTKLGARAPLHLGASFKILLAHLGEDRINEITKKSLTRAGGGTVQEREKLKKELETIRKNGYAASRCDGFGAISAPIRNADGKVIAGISVIAPSARLTSKRIREVILFVQEAAEGISVRLGSH